MKTYEYRKYLIRKNYSEEEILTQIELIRHIEKLCKFPVDKVITKEKSKEDIEKSIKWKILPWKKEKYLDAIEDYIKFSMSKNQPKSSYSSIDNRVCPLCNENTPISSVYCEHCGGRIGKTNSLVLNSIDDSIRKNKILFIGIILIVVMIIVAGAIYAPKYMKEQEQIKIAEEKEAAIKQQVNEFTKKVDEMKYSTLAEGVEIVDKYGYKYTYENISGGISDEDAVISDIAVNGDGIDSEVQTHFIIDSKENVSATMASFIEKYVNKTANNAKKIKKHFACDIAYIGIDGQEIEIKKSKEYTITGFNSFDFASKRILLTVDSNKHIKEVKEAEAKALEEQKKSDTAAAQAQAEQAKQEASMNYTVYVTPSGTKYHLEGCRTIRGSSTYSMTKQEAINQNYDPCGVCHP